MPAALDWGISGHLQLLRFRLHKIHVRFGFAGCLYLYLVRANQINRFGSQPFKFQQDFQLAKLPLK
jgi:hypothetical protein